MQGTSPSSPVYRALKDTFKVVHYEARKAGDWHSAEMPSCYSIILYPKLSQFFSSCLTAGGCQGNVTDFLQLSLKHDEERYTEIRDWILLFLENPKQLQQICREVTRQALLFPPTAQASPPTHPREKIDALPVPPKVKTYLNLSELDSMV